MGEGNLVKKILETFKTHMEVGGKSIRDGVEWGEGATWVVGRGSGKNLGKGDWG